PPTLGSVDPSRKIREGPIDLQGNPPLGNGGFLATTPRYMEVRSAETCTARPPPAGRTGGSRPHRGGGHRCGKEAEMATTRRAGILAVGALLIWGSGSALAQSSSPAPSSGERSDGSIPARLSRQVSPSPGTLWRPPALGEYTNVLKAGERVPIDPQRRYDLVELIDLAHRTN